MENTSDFSRPAHGAREGNSPIILIEQLMRRVASMGSVDELLLWVANAMTQSLEVEAIYFWASQAYTNGQLRTELRAGASRNLALPWYVTSSPQIVGILERFLLERHGAMPFPVTQILSTAQALELVQYDLQYWTVYLLRKPVLLPPKKDASAPGQMAIPLCLAASIFTRELPGQSLLRAISFLLEQAIRVAANNGFLPALTSAPAGTSNPWFPTTAPVHASVEVTPPPLTLSELVPHQTQNIEAMQASNPFANAVVITDKKARRLYSAIDGRKSVAELTSLTSLDQQEMEAALRFLLQRERIQLREPGGKAVEAARFLDHT